MHRVGGLETTTVYKRWFYFHKILIYAIQNQKYRALMPNTPKSLVTCKLA